MVPLLLILLFCCVLGVLHTYLLYPQLTIGAAAARGCNEVRQAPPPTAGWPDVYVLMAVHNEAQVLPAKLRSLAAQDYAGRLHLHFGSDGSTDATNALLTTFSRNSAHPVRLHLRRDRSGKPLTVDRLAAEVVDPRAVLLLTDASVMLAPSTVSELVRPMLDDERVGIVDARIVHTGVDEATISVTEDRYISREVALKQAESCLWRRMLGPFGGCFAIRRTAFTTVPANFLVDDFYLCMHAYERGYLGLSSDRAVAYEGVGQRLSDEFRRKRRIGAGNWQNLLRFRKLWWPPWSSSLAYAFFSHKILRWMTPLLLLIGGACWALAVGLTGNYWGGVVLLLLIALLTLSWLIPPVFARFNLPCTRVRALRYFIAMNVALLLGFFDYLTGIHSNVWQPSHRHQDDGPQ